MRHYGRSELEDEQIRRRRLQDVEDALLTGESLSWLSEKWNVTRVSVCVWCDKYLPDDKRKQLAENGKLVGGRKRRQYDTGARLELIKLLREQEWSWRKMGEALGVGPSALLNFVALHAPHGLDEALEDYSEDEDTPAAVIAA